MLDKNDPIYIEMALPILDKYGEICSRAVLDLRGQCDLPMPECLEVIRKAFLVREKNQLQKENDELRELCKKLYSFVYECQLACDQYLSTYDPTTYDYDYNTCKNCWMVREMNRLGIETDDTEE